MVVIYSIPILSGSDFKFFCWGLDWLAISGCLSPDRPSRDGWMGPLRKINPT